MNRLPGQLVYLLPAVLILIADQATKAWVEAVLPLGARMDVLSFFAWVHVLNTGASFSMLDDASGWQRWFFIAVGLGFSAWLVWELARLRRSDHWLAIAYALILGGAGGNLVDRVQSGAVTDFVLVHWFDRAYFPAFNLADGAITIGACIWIALIVLEMLGRGPLVEVDERGARTRNPS